MMSLVELMWVHRFECKYGKIIYKNDLLVYKIIIWKLVYNRYNKIDNEMEKLYYLFRFEVEVLNLKLKNVYIY